jgi:hypothetical protein
MDNQKSHPTHLTIPTPFLVCTVSRARPIFSNGRGHPKRNRDSLVLIINVFDDSNNNKKNHPNLDFFDRALLRSREIKFRCLNCLEVGFCMLLYYIHVTLFVFFSCCGLMSLSLVSFLVV